MLRSNDLGHELRFWDCPSGEAIALASACRDLPWASARVTLGYHCQGVFRNASDATSVHAIDRSGAGELLATVDDLGQVSLFRNPCVRLSGDPHAPGAPNRRSFAAHASAALDCRWASAKAGGDAAELVVSVGGYDLALMQWRRVKEEPRLAERSAQRVEEMPQTPAGAREKRRQKRAQNQSQSLSGSQ